MTPATVHSELLHTAEPGTNAADTPPTPAFRSARTLPWSTRFVVELNMKWDNIPYKGLMCSGCHRQTEAALYPSMGVPATGAYFSRCCRAEIWTADVRIPRDAAIHAAEDEAAGHYRI